MRTLALSLLLALVPAAPAAAAFPDNSAVLLASPGEFVTSGLPHEYDDLNSALTLTGTSGDVTLHAAGTDGSTFSLEFAAKPGSLLQPGVYKNVERASFRNANRAGMEITGNGHGCNTITGWFEVKDIAVDSNSQVQRLQVLYEQHCEGAAAAVFGEVRWGEPAGVTPSELRWPASQFGSATARAGVVLLAPSPLSLTSASITGPGADDFSFSFLTCTGSCPPATSVGASFAPASPGTRSATLHLVDSGGTTYDVPLRGSTSR
jgi:hypothetical protein